MTVPLILVSHPCLLALAMCIRHAIMVVVCVWLCCYCYCLPPGTAAQARELVDLGFHIGVTGWLLDRRRNAALEAAVRDVIPLDRLMVETDAPWLSIARGRHSHPRDVLVILGRVAELKGVDPGECAAAVAANVARLFGIVDAA